MRPTEFYDRVVRTVRGPQVDPQAFIDSYDLQSRVVVGRGEGMTTTLGQALEAEERLCQADPSIRQNKAKRLTEVAKMLNAGGSLRPEDQHLIGRESQLKRAAKAAGVLAAGAALIYFVGRKTN